MKYPLGRFVLEHSENHGGGKTLVMNIGKGTDQYFEICVILWEVREAEIFIIIDSKDIRAPFNGKLTKQEKKWAFKSLFKFGIRDDR